MFGSSFLMRKAGIKKADKTFVPAVQQKNSKTSAFSSVRRNLPQESNELIRTNSLKSNDLEKKLKSKNEDVITAKKRTQKEIFKQKIAKKKEKLVTRTRKS